MAFYKRRIFPWINDKLTTPELEKVRAEALAPAHGRVVEVGFGSGLNLPHYPDRVKSITGVEPNEGMRERAAPRIGASRIAVEIIAGRAESLSFPDSTFDTAVSTLTLCSVADPSSVLSELRRVLRDAGRLIVLEHGLAEEPKIARWQNRLNPIQKIVGCGCHLNRPIAHLVESAGFHFEALRQFYAPKVPRTHGWVTLGSAVKSPSLQTCGHSG